MKPVTTAEKAARFLALHRGPRILVLPNIWDPLGAILLESMGYPAVATASAAVAYSLGQDDGEFLPFDTMLERIGRIAAAVEVPVTADIERGYADDPAGVAENVRRVLEAGAAGINLEDGIAEGGPLRPAGEQCARIRAAREMAERQGIHLVINARIDVFLQEDDRSIHKKTAEAINRGKAYLDAGADCLYPILAGDLDTLGKIHRSTGAPINAFLSAATAPLRELEAIGIRRLSLGPGLLKASLTAMRRAVGALRDDGSYEPFTGDLITSEEIRKLFLKT